MSVIQKMRDPKTGETYFTQFPCVLAVYDNASPSNLAPMHQLLLGLADIAETQATRAAESASRHIQAGRTETSVERARACNSAHAVFCRRVAFFKAEAEDWRRIAGGMA